MDNAGFISSTVVKDFKVWGLGFGDSGHGFGV